MNAIEELTILTAGILRDRMRTQGLIDIADQVDEVIARAMQEVVRTMTAAPPPARSYAILIGQHTLDKLTAREWVTLVQEDGARITLMDASDFPRASSPTATALSLVAAIAEALHAPESCRERIPEAARMVAGWRAQPATDDVPPMGPYFHPGDEA